jgi:hypothetical protein
MTCGLVGTRNKHDPGMFNQLSNPGERALKGVGMKDETSLTSEPGSGASTRRDEAGMAASASELLGRGPLKRR